MHCYLYDILGSQITPMNTFDMCFPETLKVNTAQIMFTFTPGVCYGNPETTLRDNMRTEIDILTRIQYISYNMNMFRV